MHSRVAPPKPQVIRRLPTRAKRAKAVESPVLDPIITMNSGGIIQSSSDSIEHIFGWTPAELYGQNVKVLIPEPKRSDLDRYLDRYRNSGLSKVLKRSRVFDAVRKDGKIIQIELSMSRADLPANAPAYFIGIIRGVGKDIHVGDDSTEARTRLQELVTEQTRALATANLRLHLADRLAALGTLAAGLGHDMNSVLLPVRARLNAMEHTGISAAAMNHLTAVRRSIAYLQHLSDGLHFLALDPDGNGAASMAEGSTNISRWWHDMGTILRKTVPKHVVIQVSFPKDLPDVQVAPRWLTQAMLNLIVNAGESIPEGRRNGTVRVWAKCSEGGKMVRLGVTDNGRGMMPTIQRRAFDLFFTTKSRSMGTGLGLPLARKVAVRAGGDIELRSVLGKGTTAVLLLPIATGSAYGGKRHPKQKTEVAITIRNHRVASLISQILIGAGVEIKAVKESRPGKPDMWITEPTPRALTAALQLRKGRRRSSIVLLGLPPKAARKRWEQAEATVIEQIDNFEAIRHTLGEVMSSRSQRTSKGTAK